MIPHANMPHTPTRSLPRPFRAGSRLLAGLFLGLALLANPLSVAAEDPAAPRPDRIVIKKAERRMLLMKDNQVLHAFEIALGDQPEGDKLEEGDWRTPEGRYVIDWRNDRSRFYKSLHISYPSPRDIQESSAAGVNPGGMIMIHGHPPEAQTNPEEYDGKDWTNGCIALQNDDMDLVWSLVADGTPIDILP